MDGGIPACSSNDTGIFIPVPLESLPEEPGTRGIGLGLLNPHENGLKRMLVEKLNTHAQHADVIRLPMVRSHRWFTQPRFLKVNTMVYAETILLVCAAYVQSTDPVVQLCIKRCIHALAFHPMV